MEKKLIALLTILTLLIIPTILAEVFEDDDEDIMFLDFELEELLSFVNGIISLILFFIAFLAYKRDGRKRFFIVSMAFLIFATKSFFDSIELFGFELEILGSLAVVLEFLVLLLFFFGVTKRGA